MKSDFFFLIDKNYRFTNRKTDKKIYSPKDRLKDKYKTRYKK